MTVALMPLLDYRSGLCCFISKPESLKFDWVVNFGLNYALFRPYPLKIMDVVIEMSESEFQDHPWTQPPLWGGTAGCEVTHSLGPFCRGEFCSPKFSELRERRISNGFQQII